MLVLHLLWLMIYFYKLKADFFFLMHSTFSLFYIMRLVFAEGKRVNSVFPDYLDKPSRTMVTSEHSTSRMTHVIMDPKYKRYRLLSPEETEKLNTFPAGWTKSIPDSARYFTMGNALVVDLVKEIAKGIVSVSNNNF